MDPIYEGLKKVVENMEHISVIDQGFQLGNSYAFCFNDVNPSYEWRQQLEEQSFHKPQPKTNFEIAPDEVKYLRLHYFNYYYDKAQNFKSDELDNSPLDAQKYYHEYRYYRQAFSCLMGHDSFGDGRIGYYSSRIRSYAIGLENLAKEKKSEQFTQAVEKVKVYNSYSFDFSHQRLSAGISWFNKVLRTDLAMLSFAQAREELLQEDPDFAKAEKYAMIADQFIKNGIPDFTEAGAEGDEVDIMLSIYAQGHKKQFAEPLPLF